MLRQSQTFSTRLNCLVSHILRAQLVKRCTLDYLIASRVVVSWTPTVLDCHWRKKNATLGSDIQREEVYRDSDKYDRSFGCWWIELDKCSLKNTRQDMKMLLNYKIKKKHFEHQQNVHERHLSLKFEEFSRKIIRSNWAELVKRQSCCPKLRAQLRSCRCGSRAPRVQLLGHLRVTLPVSSSRHSLWSRGSPQPPFGLADLLPITSLLSRRACGKKLCLRASMNEATSIAASDGRHSLPCWWMPLRTGQHTLHKRRLTCNLVRH